MTTNNDIILCKLIKNQKQNISLEKKLTFSDLKRISSNLSNDIFDDNCSLWNGYVTNLNSKKNNCYISFFYKNKKIALHRLLYINFIGELKDDEYLKFNCENKGKCCSLNHLAKSCVETENKYYINKKNAKLESINKEIVLINNQINKPFINKNLVSF
jgi:hypothetical protein